MATVREIPPRKKEPTLKKVVAYCPVSMKAQDQLDNLVAQEQYYFIGAKYTFLESLLNATRADELAFK